MIFKFKFNLGQEVFAVSKDSVCVYKPCEQCKGKGYLHILEHPSKTISCDGCRSSSRRPFKKRMTWSIIDRSLNIGQARVEITDTDLYQHRDGGPIKEEYMCAETGVGSGQLHKAESLFPTKEDAQKFCDEMNSKIDWEILEDLK